MVWRLSRCLGSSAESVGRASVAAFTRTRDRRERTSVHYPFAGSPGRLRVNVFKGLGRGCHPAIELLRFALRQSHQITAQAIPQRIAGRFELGVLEERLARSRRAQIVGIDHGFDEKR